MAKVEYKVEIANKFKGSRVVGNLYGVGKFVGGRRHGWVLEPQDDEKLARSTAKKLNAKSESAGWCRRTLELMAEAEKGRP